MAKSQAVAGRPAASAAQRHVVRTANLSVTVDEYGVFRDDLQQWLSQHSGRVDNASLTHREGVVSWATLDLRVPASELDAFLGWSETSLELSQLGVSSEDVSETWIDQTAQITTLQATEQRLLSILQTDAASLADVLAVEKELWRVRGELEVIEARHRALADRVSMASVSMQVGVRTLYEPPIAQPFFAEAADAWGTSMHAFGQAARALAILGVASVPWIGTLGLFLGLALFFLTIAVRRFSSLSSAEQPRHQ
jgi:hypothetical protein